MIKHKIKLFIICILLIFFWNSAYASINFTLTPLRYEIDVEQWDKVTRLAQIRNNSDETVTLFTGASDFQANDATGTPSFVRKSELVFPDQQISTWITIDTESITLAPWETKWFSFDIDVPFRATPGWHYWAVFFKNPGSETTTSWNIGINVDYGILILVNVAWEIVVDIVIDGVVIWQKTIPALGPETGWTGSGKNQENWNEWNDSNETWNISIIGTDDCPFWDLTASNFDGKCIDNPFSSKENKDSDNSTNTLNEWILDDDQGLPDRENNDWTNGNSWINWLETFEVSFTLPINNNWNTHVKPQWKIKLVDENWKTIKWVGKEVQKNDFGAVIWEEIVDYLPLNDEWGNVLPKTKRNFESVWKWFPYKSYDDSGNQVVKYWQPWEYYTKQNLAENRFQKPWERISEKRKTKTIKAVIEVEYEDADWEMIEYNSAEEFKIEYVEQYIWINPYVVIPFLSFITFFFLWWIIAAKRKIPCINKDCKQKLKRKTKRCSKCDTLQKEKKISVITKTKKSKEKDKKKKSKSKETK